MLARNLTAAFNGGTIDTSPTGFVIVEPPPAGTYTPTMLGWEATDGLERWIFRKCINTGSMAIARQKAPAKATIPYVFRAVVPDSGAVPFRALMDDTIALA